MSHPWYHTTRWRKRRAYQLADEPLCRMCEDQGRITEATVADHIEPHNGDYDKFWHGKLQSLCATCHNVRKQRIERSGYSAACDVDGMPIDPGHPWRREDDAKE